MSDLVRKEVKYLVDKSKYEIIRSAFEPYLAHDTYYFQKVHNIYYDNDFDGIVSTSLDKPPYKEKLRSRAYENDGQLYHYAFIELKKKYKGIVYKRRLKLPIEKLSAIMRGELPYSELGDSQIANEIRYFINHTNCYPKVYISHERYSLRGIENPGLRVTFDQNLKTRQSNLFFGSTDEDQLTLDPDMRIMEIKAEGGFPLWLRDILRDLKLFPSSYSKYGKIYEAQLAENRLRGDFDNV